MPLLSLAVPSCPWLSLASLPSELLKDGVCAWPGRACGAVRPGRVGRGGSKCGFGALPAWVVACGRWGVWPVEGAVAPCTGWASTSRAREQQVHEPWHPPAHEPVHMAGGGALSRAPSLLLAPGAPHGKVHQGWLCEAGLACRLPLTCLSCDRASSPPPPTWLNTPSPWLLPVQGGFNRPLPAETTGVKVVRD